jgi:hypothetical protein
MGPAGLTGHSVECGKSTNCMCPTPCNMQACAAGTDSPNSNARGGSAGARPLVFTALNTSSQHQACPRRRAARRWDAGESVLGSRVWIAMLCAATADPAPDGEHFCARSRVILMKDEHSEPIVNRFQAAMRHRADGAPVARHAEHRGLRSFGHSSGESPSAPSHSLGFDAKNMLEASANQQVSTGLESGLETHAERWTPCPPVFT